ncbi:ABC transporter ATP-binding protein [Roseibium polysiphoniae]|uniref:ABC transporter ATP-binding protein n=1 Tax=Roseibium polysiphoniae TaxID=2571221 RepID=A0ABR9C4Z7_9HYPH|nr:ABC transporter ATP-binding protein [Roseibium polysiphoniae]MBD8874932.1 ABC transporter ATP-binding protein [Roseibium polysiphoniae]
MSVLLQVDNLQAGYGEAQVLFDVSLTILAGEVVTLMGRNGMGKTTTIKSLMGMIASKAGKVAIEGRDMTGQPSYQVAKAGLGLVPEGRQVFPTLSVEENLVATSALTRKTGAWDLAAVYELFPRLQERRRNLGSQLSGGEQQMLAIGRALMTNPKLLILDEATEGLAPLVRAEIWACLETLKSRDQSILIVDKNVSALEKLAERHVILEKGRTVWTGSTADLKAAPELRERYLGA